ncbi:hypothetical protein [Nostoc sp.]|uniref:hypothetical protein n=1 Tax=Nostoc sp. TaxID=1180 RepID=UPI002FF93C6D
MIPIVIASHTKNPKPPAGWGSWGLVSNQADMISEQSVGDTLWDLATDPPLIEKH